MTTRINDFSCEYPCDDIDREMIFPELRTDPDKVEIVMISEDIKRALEYIGRGTVPRKMKGPSGGRWLELRQGFRLFPVLLRIVRRCP